MTEFLLFAFAALALPVGAVIVTHFVSWQLDRELARGSVKNAAQESHSSH